MEAAIDLLSKDSGMFFFLKQLPNIQKMFKWSKNIKKTCACGQKYVLDKEGQTGAINSNPTTANYRPNSNCLWTIEAPKNFTILARFREFHVEREDVCGFDYVMVYTGNLQHLNHPKFGFQTPFQLKFLSPRQR